MPYLSFIVEIISKTLNNFNLKLKDRSKRKTTMKMDTPESEYCFRPFVFEQAETSKVRPTPRSGHRIVCNDEYLYLYGGYNPNVATNIYGTISPYLFRQLWRFNLSTGVWELLPAENVPPFVASSSVMLIGEVLLVYGGSGVPFGANSSNKLYVCDLSQEVMEFREVTTYGKGPIPGYGQACFVQDNKVYVLGGTTGYTYWSDIEALNIKTSNWETIYTCHNRENEPVGRYRHELGHLDGKTYVLGGGTSDISFGFTEINVYNHEKKVWTTSPTIGDVNLFNEYPPPRRYHSSVQKDSKIIIFGGVYNKISLQDSWSLDLKTLRWTYLPSLSLPCPTFFHDSCLMPSGKVYTFGGVSTKDYCTERSSDLYTAWICVPSLKEIAWEAVLHYKYHENPITEPLIPTPFRYRLNPESRPRFFNNTYYATENGSLI